MQFLGAFAGVWFLVWFATWWVISDGCSPGQIGVVLPNAERFCILAMKMPED